MPITDQSIFDKAPLKRNFRLTIGGGSVGQQAINSYRRDSTFDLAYSLEWILTELGLEATETELGTGQQWHTMSLPWLVDKRGCGRVLDVALDTESPTIRFEGKLYRFSADFRARKVPIDALEDVNALLGILECIKTPAEFLDCLEQFVEYTGLPILNNCDGANPAWGPIP